MTLSAIEVAAVIERLVRQPGVTVVRRCPPVRRMAYTTVHRGIEVAGIHAGSICAVVTGRT